MLGALLEDCGFVVALAADAAAALEIESAWAPDVVLVDLRLPVINGMQLTRALRARESMRGVPIVACTGYTKRATLEEALEAGCDSVLIKPFGAYFAHRERADRAIVITAIAAS
ncbi:MAG: response regulator [Myxococcota bacterium]|nr:response regulator [Myxococcota bacterium]